MESLFIFGRQPAVGLAELESLYGESHVFPIGSISAVSDLVPESVFFDRLGSTVKLGKYLGSIEGTDWKTIQSALPTFIDKCLETIPSGSKVQLGISSYGVRINTKQLLAGGLNLKKHLRKAGFSARLIPNQELELSSAQVLHNHLATDKGIELLLVATKTQVLVGRTIAVQDITAYAKRDQERPKRDAFVGMLPPKLAQTIINLATASLPPQRDHVVLDPFCGTGVLLQEALLMGYGAYGTDLEPRMIDYSSVNLDWLKERYDIESESPLAVGDATSYDWNEPFTTVACETYLGHPLTNWPRPDKLQQIIGTCNVIIEKFMINLADQIGSGTRLCLAVPAWRDPNGRLYHLPLLDHLEKIGYNRVSFKHVRESDLVYFRPDQIVTRELLVITRK